MWKVHSDDDWTQCQKVGRSSINWFGDSWLHISMSQFPCLGQPRALTLSTFYIIVSPSVLKWRGTRQEQRGGYKSTPTGPFATSSLGLMEGFSCYQTVKSLNPVTWATKPPPCLACCPEGVTAVVRQECRLHRALPYNGRSWNRK